MVTTFRAESVGQGRGGSGSGAFGPVKGAGGGGGGSRFLRKREIRENIGNKRVVTQEKEG